MASDVAMPRSENPPVAAGGMRAEWIIVCMALLMVGVLDLPNRTTATSVSALDPLGMFKLACRGAALLFLTPFVLQRISLAAYARRFRVFVPWILLTGWALLSALWSPLRAFSFAQAVSLGTLVMIGMATAFSAGDEQYERRVLKGLILLLAGFCTLVALVHLVAPGASGLGRDEFSSETGGMIHPTSAGAIAGLAMILNARFWRRSQPDLFPAWLRWGIFGVAGAVLYLATSRTAMIATIAAFGWLALRGTPLRRYLQALLLAGLALAALLLVDPNFRYTSAAAEVAEGYVTRGESKEQLSSATGRDILWEVLWDSWKESPWIGHGYLVGTRNGIVDVWTVAENRPAHNVWLQALVSTGVVGFVLFVSAMLWLIWLTIIDTFLRRDDWGLASLLSAVLLWQLIWGLMDSSVLGPMRPDTVCFFVLAGLLVARTDDTRITGNSTALPRSAPSPEVVA